MKGKLNKMFENRSTDGWGGLNQVESKEKSILVGGIYTPDIRSSKKSTRKPSKSAAGYQIYEDVENEEVTTPARSTSRGREPSSSSRDPSASSRRPARSTRKKEPESAAKPALTETVKRSSRKAAKRL